MREGDGIRDEGRMQQDEQDDKLVMTHDEGLCKVTWQMGGMTTQAKGRDEGEKQ